jgi:hypothetical protein
MDPQTTGWPLTPAGREYVLLNACRRKPMTDAGVAIPDMEPVTPAAGYWPSFPGDTNDGDTRWLDAHASLVEMVRGHRGTVDIALLGDGITQGWGGGWNGSPFRKVWTDFFPDYRTVNLGIEGDRIENILWRIDHGALDQAEPRVVVLFAGSSNQPSHCNGGTLAAGLALAVRNLRRRLVQSHVVLVKPIPGRGLDIRQLHAQLDTRALQQDDHVHIVDFSSDLRNIDNSLKALGFAPDFVHLDDLGYEIFATRLRHVLCRLLGRTGGGRWDDLPRARLRLVHEHTTALISASHPDAGGNAYGLEGGMVLKQAGTYHLFSAEMWNDPRWNAMRLAHWTSPDRITWKRRPTLMTSSNDMSGQDPRAAIWAPMPIYDEAEERWNLFHVAYRSINHPEGLAGRIWRAVSTVRGSEGIYGPWDDTGVILMPGPESQAWEGSQGVDSFFPFRAPSGNWLGFYGSSDARSWFRVGLAESPTLAGPWHRLPNGNPTTLSGARGSENPVVTRLPSGRYIAVFETVFNEVGFGYAESLDGVHWSEAAELEVTASNRNVRKVRTPLGLVSEDDGTYSLFYTGFSKADDQWGEVWYVRIRVEE